MMCALFIWFPLFAQSQCLPVCVFFPREKQREIEMAKRRDGGEELWLWYRSDLTLTSDNSDLNVHTFLGLSFYLIITAVIPHMTLVDSS